MQTIGELQHEIQILHGELKKMDERLNTVNEGLNFFKDSPQIDSVYEHIYQLAEKMPAVFHPAVSFSQKEKSIYFGILLMTATLEDSISDQQLLFLQRIIMEDPFRKRIDYYMVNLGRIQPDNVIFCLDNEVIVSHANQLLLDMMIIAKLGRKCSVKTFSVISDIASILKKSKEELTEICLVAAAVLLQDSRGLPDDVVSVVRLERQYGYYLDEMPTWKALVEDAVKTEQRELTQKLKNYSRVYFSSSDMLGYGLNLI